MVIHRSKEQPFIFYLFPGFVVYMIAFTLVFNSSTWEKHKILKPCVSSKYFRFSFIFLCYFIFGLGFRFTYFNSAFVEPKLRLSRWS